MMSDEAEDTQQVEKSVMVYLIWYRGKHYPAECVEVTPDTAFFQVESKCVRDGIFTTNRLDFRDFKGMGIILYPVFHPPLLEQ